jgi:hypothetical protein
MEASNRIRTQAELRISNFLFLEFDEIHPNVSTKLCLMGFPHSIHEQLHSESRHA